MGSLHRNVVAPFCLKEVTLISSAARNLVFPFLTPQRIVIPSAARKLRTGAWVDFQRRKTSHEEQFPNSFVGLMTFSTVRSFLAASTNASTLL